MVAKPKGRKHIEVEKDDLPSKFTPEKPKSKMYEKQERFLNVEGEFADEVDDEIESEEEFVAEAGNEETEGDVEIEEHYWLPGEGDEDQELTYEPRAYKMYHKCLVEWSCLTLDIIPDKLGENRTQFPHTCYVIAGTQANTADNNHILLMKWSRMHKTKRDRDDTDSISSLDSDSDDSDSESFLDEDPIVNVEAIPHKGTVNRIRVCPQLPNLVSTWSELGKVSMWDISDSINALNMEQGSSKSLKPSSLAKKSAIKPKFTYNDHLDEGFSMDWNPNSTAQFATGDRKGKICLWQPIQGGSWVVDAINGNFQSSVETIHWKRDCNSPFIFAAGLVNSNICIVDIRTQSEQLIIQNSHNGDVNCVSWNPFCENLLLSGSDDATIKLWDIRSTNSPLETFNFHREPVLSIDWHRQDQDVFLAASLDNSISFWDVAIEDEGSEGTLSDINTSASSNDPPNIPKKLLFLHMGQEHIAEAKWHGQIPSLAISTAQDSFNVFIPNNL
ncbi:WD domain, G-beta repeat-containing protein [Cryptosporidium felis]|nr:WD domain, G-beta repeat-containing protein [Cryptosporidium felis]